MGDVEVPPSPLPAADLPIPSIGDADLATIKAERAKKNDPPLRESVSGPLQQMFEGLKLSEDNPVTDSQLPDAFIFALKETTGKLTMQAAQEHLQVHKWAKSLLTVNKRLGAAPQECPTSYYDQVSNVWSGTRSHNTIFHEEKAALISVQRLKETSVLYNLNSLADYGIICEVPGPTTYPARVNDKVAVEVWYYGAKPRKVPGYKNTCPLLIVKECCTRSMVYNMIDYEAKYGAKEDKWEFFEQGTVDIWEVDADGKVVGETAFKTGRDATTLSLFAARHYARGRQYQAVPHRVTKLRTSQEAGNWSYYEPRFLRLFYRAYEKDVINLLTKIPASGYNEILDQAEETVGKRATYSIPKLKLKPIATRQRKEDISEFSRVFKLTKAEGRSFDERVRQLALDSIGTDFKDFDTMVSKLIEFGSRFIPQLKNFQLAIDVNRALFTGLNFGRRVIQKGNAKQAAFNAVDSINDMIGYAIVGFIMSDVLRVNYQAELKRKNSKYIRGLVQYHPQYPTVAFVRGTAPPTMDIAVLREWGSNATVATGSNTEFYLAQVDAVRQWLKDHPYVTDIVGHSRGAGIAYNAAMQVEVSGKRKEKVKFCGLDGAMTLALKLPDFEAPNSLMSRNINMASALDSTLDPMGKQERINALMPVNDPSHNDASFTGFLQQKAEVLANLLKHSDSIEAIQSTLLTLNAVKNVGLGHDAGAAGTCYNTATMKQIGETLKKKGYPNANDWTMVATGFKTEPSVKMGQWPAHTKIKPRPTYKEQTQGGNHYKNLLWSTDGGGDFELKHVVVT
jgi:hypothetical protein